jgi:hypothetical protein
MHDTDFRIPININDPFEVRRYIFDWAYNQVDFNYSYADWTREVRRGEYTVMIIQSIFTELFTAEERATKFDREFYNEILHQYMTTENEVNL